jgi:hypothetical protein
MIGGLAMLVVMLVGLVIITGMGRFPFGRGPAGWFLVIWVLIGLVGAGLSFFNAAVRSGMTLPDGDRRRETSGHVSEGEPDDSLE